MTGKEEERPGFSEEAIRGLHDLELRLPPVEIPGDQVPPRPHYWGHRERLRARFLGGGHGAMPEYELLELVLFNAIPRIDVKPLAKALLAAFGDLNGVVAASEHRLLQVPGTTAKVHLQLKVVEAVAHRMARAKVMERSVISSWEALMTYCRTVMAYRDTEQFRILFLDRKNVLIADEAQAKGTVARSGLPAGGGEAGARAQCERDHPRSQPPVRRPDAEPVRHLDDRADRHGLRGDRGRRPRPRGDRKGGGGLVQESQGFSDGIGRSGERASPLHPVGSRL